SYQRFNFYYNNNEEKEKRGDPVNVSEEIDSTYFYGDNGEVTVFFDWVSKYKLKTYRMSGISSTIQQKVDNQETLYIRTEKSYYGKEYNSKINPIVDTITIRNFMDTLIIHERDKKDR